MKTSILREYQTAEGYKILARPSQTLKRALNRFKAVSLRWINPW
ncbi:hypothetical protein [Pedobacter psychrodurus]|nr:hypothetical protein [Pedobacter psychrodurus]